MTYVYILLYSHCIILRYAMRDLEAQSRSFSRPQHAF